ncbi:MAG: ammonia-forming cytochrome c nitrite reductase subunit c552 [Micrococcales bacterium]|nr:ammonia-forming cytochrome c nitrite reductase subunit c552 [Micrococcales bacterium]
MTDTAPAAKKPRWWLFVGVAAAAAVITFVITALVANIFGNKQDAKIATYKRLVTITDTTYDSATWGQNFPVQYDLFKATAEFEPTVFNDALVPADKDRVDDGVADGHEDGAPLPEARDKITKSKIEADPRLKKMWAGYAFAIDYGHLRGHEYMLIDQQNTRRVLQRPQAGACLNCHASLPEVLDALDSTDRAAGWDIMNGMKYGEAAAYAKAPVGCIDCHDPKTMELRITRPALANGLTAWKQSQGISGYDVNKDATTSEMRSFVCAQCHSEYYMKGDEKTLTFPWADGLDANDQYSYYQEAEFKDFEHKLTGAAIIKIQHPEFETWTTSVHAANGVSCADCHMPYVRDGGQKVSNHDVKSPMGDVNKSCGVCHPAGEEMLTTRVRTIQNRFVDSRDRAMDSLVVLIDDIVAAQEAGNVPQDRIDLALEYQRKATMYTDWLFSENSYGFHSPDYLQRLCSQALDASRIGQLVLLGVDPASLDPSDNSVQNLDDIANRGGTL